MILSRWCPLQPQALSFWLSWPDCQLLASVFSLPGGFPLPWKTTLTTDVEHQKCLENYGPTFPQLFAKIWLSFTLPHPETLSISPWTCLLNNSESYGNGLTNRLDSACMLIDSFLEDPLEGSLSFPVIHAEPRLPFLGICIALWPLEKWSFLWI